MSKREARYSLIVFDWDGTLMDSASGIVACIQAASRDMGLEVPPRERASHVIGLGLRDALSIAVPGLPESRYLQFAEHYRKHFQARSEAMELFAGVPAMLGRLRDAGRKLAIATGKSRKGLDRALETCRLQAYFVASRCADETDPKPHPAMLNELMRELSLAPHDLLMIGDTSHDLDMAASAGVDAIAVTYGAHPEASLRARAPKSLVGSVAELDRWLTAHA